MTAPRERLVLACILMVSVWAINGCASSLSGNSIVQITPTSAVLAPGQQLQFNAVAGVPTTSRFLWQVNGVVGGSTATGTITPDGVYTAPSSTGTQSMKISIQNQPAAASVSLYNPSNPTPGTVASTQNPLVAAYAITIPMGASVQVQFGADTTYGLSTSSVSSVYGGNVTIYVAGMRASTTYHMQAIVNNSNGSQFKDMDHIFLTEAITSSSLPNINVQPGSVGTPSPGVELLSLTQYGNQNILCALATDLNGNVIWYYDLPAGAYPEPIKLLPNGHMILITAGSLNDVREIDLAGNLIHQVTLDSMTQSISHLADFQIISVNHDVLVLPNGHLILLLSTSQPGVNVPGSSPPTPVQGNALIDWDLDRGAVWTWSTFDHLDLSHAPYGASDWTHGNALIYSQDDGNLIFSMRNQNWIVKINYADGAGDGSVLWRFGPDGDFTLPNQQTPIEWNYGQHNPSILSSNSSGIFSLLFFNNGNNRLIDSNNDVCGSAGVAACYSSVPIFQLNEYDKTATVLWEDNLSPAYSLCCGDAQMLPSGNVEFDVADDVNSPGVSYIEEMTTSGSPELVWRMNINSQLAYRGMRIPSLYPGQTWPAQDQQNARENDVTH